MKKLISTLFLSLLAVVHMYAYLPVGYATCNGGTTGGGNANAVTVSSLAELKAALPSNASNKVIYISGTIQMDGCYSPSGLSNITIYGLPGATLKAQDYAAYTKDETGILFLKDSKNIIIQNVIFQGNGAYDTDGYDNLCLQNCQNVWVDHCDFRDGSDGNFDIIRQSDYIAVTHCIFQYTIDPIAGGSGGTDDHRYTNLIGNSDSMTDDKGTLHITFQHCWWAEGCVERMPRVRFGQVHLINNLYSSSVGRYCLRAAYQADVYVERNAYVGVKNPVTNNTINGVGQEFNATFTGNYTSGTSGTDSAEAIQALDGYAGAASNPYAAYCEAISRIDDASTVEAYCRANAGAILTSNAPEIGGELPALAADGAIDQSIVLGYEITPINFTASGTASSITVGDLPQGLTYIQNGLTLTISGTATESGTYTVYASDDNGQTVVISGTITVNEAGNISDFWNFSDDIFVNLGDALTQDQTVNGLTIIYGNKNIGIINYPATCDGYDFTHALSFSGSGNTGQCAVKFDVTGSCVIYVYAVSGNVNTERPLRLATANGTLQDKGVTTVSKLVYTYIGGAETLYLYSGNSGIRVFGIAVSYLPPSPGTGMETTDNATTSIRYRNGEIQNPEGTVITLYNLAGQCLKRTNSNLNMTAYPQGIYIIRTASGESIKVIHRH